MSAISRDLFLSHHSEADDFVADLTKALADPSADGSDAAAFTVWSKKTDIVPGLSIPGAINDGLEGSRFVGIVLTPHYFTNDDKWTAAEWHSSLGADPDNRHARIIPLLAMDCPYVPFVLRHLECLDMRGDEFLSGVQRLRGILSEERIARPVTHRGQLITPAGKVDRATLLTERAAPSADPDVITEKLYCNLLPIETYPKYIYEAPLLDSLFIDGKKGRRPPSKLDLRVAIENEQKASGKKRFSPAFRQYGDKIFSFFNLTTPDNPLACVSDHTRATEYATAMLLDDHDSRNVVTSLINMAVTRHATRIGLQSTFPPRERVYFGPAEGNQERIISWVPRQKRSERTVAKAMLGRDNRVQFWRHAGARLRVVYLGQRYYLQVNPTWVLTKDGKELMTGPKVGPLVMKWTGAERNLHVLYHVRFWTAVLQDGASSISMRAGDRTIEVSPSPAFVQQAYGIFGDQRDLLGLLDGEASLLAKEEENFTADADPLDATDDLTPSIEGEYETAED